MKKLLLPVTLILFGSHFTLIQSQLSIQPDSENPDLVKVYVRQDPSTYQKTPTQNGSIDFAVQVSASSKAVTETNARKEWSELGRVYVQQENGLYKVRIGPFDSQSEAKQTLLQAKSKGVKDAFIVVLQGTDNDKPMFQSGMEKKPDAKSSTLNNYAFRPEMEKTSHKASGSSVSEYKVRLATYLKPGAFNPEGLDKLGTLESYRKGDLTIMMIGGFHNLPDAQKARVTAISRGYNDASIVVDHNGILEEVVIE